MQRRTGVGNIYIISQPWNSFGVHLLLYLISIDGDGKMDLALSGGSGRSTLSVAFSSGSGSSANVTNNGIFYFTL